MRIDRVKFWADAKDAKDWTIQIYSGEHFLTLSRLVPFGTFLPWAGM